MPEIPGAGPTPRSGASVLITLAPAAAELGHLLRAAIDAEQVGAARLHLAPDQADLDAVLTGLREHTSLLVTADRGSPAEALVDAPFTLPETVVDGVDHAELVRQVADLAAAHPDGISVGARGQAAVPVLFAALAAGLHVRVGTADAPPAELRGGGRDDAALVARAAGLARIAGRAPLDPAAARKVLGLI